MRAITVRASDETADRLDKLAGKLDQPQSTVVECAIEHSFACQEWQVAEIEAGLAEADRGEFASGQEVLAKYLGTPFASSGRHHSDPATS